MDTITISGEKHFVTVWWNKEILLDGPLTGVKSEEFWTGYIRASAGFYEAEPVYRRHPGDLVDRNLCRWENILRFGQKQPRTIEAVVEPHPAYPVDSGLWLRTGTRLHPDTKRLTEFSEVWREIDHCPEFPKFNPNFGAIVEYAFNAGMPLPDVGFREGHVNDVNLASVGGALFVMAYTSKFVQVVEVLSGNPLVWFGRMDPLQLEWVVLRQAGNTKDIASSINSLITIIGLRPGYIINPDPVEFIRSFDKRLSSSVRVRNLN